MSANERAEAVLIVIKRLGKWALYGVLILAALIGLTVGGFLAYEAWEKRPQLVDQHAGIRLGDSLGDVQFKMGDLQRMPRDKDSDPTEEIYFSKQSNLQLDVKEGRVNFLAYVCNTEGRDYTSIGHITCADKADDIIEKYGGSVRILCLTTDGKIDNTSRAYDAIQYGLRYILENNSVRVIAVVSPLVLEGFIGKNWTPCNQ